MGHLFRKDPSRSAVTMSTMAAMTGVKERAKRHRPLPPYSMLSKANLEMLNRPKVAASKANKDDIL